ncbi:hypothetical protein BYT27DRAFT_7228159 [Phlegmacium glaucopus]|nr:hypothetical protein BYT27DRAFT_7228159 [Phlegmacium glaucopus]
MFSILNDPLVTALLNNHPNSLQPHFTYNNWLQLVHGYNSPQCNAIDNHLLHLIHSIHRFQLDRTPILINNPLNPPSHTGMSPKKVHEVSRMAAYILHFLQVNNIHTSHIRIVDIGAGQGYLTRTLKHHLPQSHILALDADQEQTRAAQQWERRLLPNATPPITHNTILITPQSLLDTVHKWVGDSPQPVPVLLVALHACGSLTLDILRSFISSVKNPHPSWYPVGVVAVGCCYNLMNTGGSPNPLTLPISAYHLAAQVPSQWLIPGSDPPTPYPSVVLAVRKVTWRALLEKALVNATPVERPLPSVDKSKSASVPARWPRRPETWKAQNPSSSSTPPPTPPQDLSCTGQTLTLLRLGRLKDSAYTNGWPAFLHIAEERLGVKFPSDSFTLLERESDEFVRNLEVLHVMRCLLGPLVETAILRDRVEWVKESLKFDKQESEVKPMSVELVNLFDQSTGSARNVAIVIAQVIPDYGCG